MLSLPNSSIFTSIFIIQFLKFIVCTKSGISYRDFSYEKIETETKEPHYPYLDGTVNYIQLAYYSTGDPLRRRE